MFLTYSEQEQARSTGFRAGEKFDALYDSTPPSSIKQKGARHCQDWREEYRKGWEAGRRYGRAA